MRKLRLILFSCLFLSLVFVACLLVVNHWFLPNKVSPFLLRQVQEKTGLFPEIRSFSFWPSKGFVLSEVRLYDSEQKEKPLLQAKTLSFQLLWAPLLFNRQIVFSDLTLDKPAFLLKRDEQGRWNLQSLFEKREEASAPPLFSHLSILDGTVEIVDETSQTASHRTFTPLRVDISFRLPDRLSFKGRSGLSDFPTEIVVNGTYSLVQKELSFHLEAQRFTEQLIQPYLGPLPFSITEARGTLRCDVSLDKNQTLSLQKIHYEGTLGLEQEMWRSAGQAVLDGFYTLWPKEPPDIDYFLTLSVKDGHFESKTFSSALEQLSGKLIFKEGTLTLEGLEGKVAGQAFRADGSLEILQEPSLTMQIRSDVDLASLQTLPWVSPLLKYGRVLSGRGTLQASLKGPIGKDTAIDYTVEGHLENASLKLDLLPQPVESVHGTIRFKPNELLLEKVEGSYIKEPFRLEAALHDFQHPRITLQLSYQAQETTSQFDATGEDLRPFRAAMKKGGIAVSFEGAILHYQDPFLDGTVSIESPLEELSTLLPHVKERMDRLGLHGNLSSQMQIQGLLKQPKDLKLQGMIQLPRLSVKQFSFQDVRAKLRYTEQVLTLSDIISQAYGGTLGGSVTWGFANPFPFTLQAESKGMQVEGFLPFVSPQLQKARGFLDGNLHLEGNATEPQAMIGNGTIAIREGNLYEAPILKNLFGVWQPILILLYPQLDEWFALKEAHAEFFIANHSIQTQDLRLIGDRLTLYGRGKIGFDQTLDARFLIRFTDPAIIERRTELSRLRNILVDETGMLAGEVRAKGTLSKPKFHYTSLPLKRLRNLFKGAADLILPGIFSEE